MSAEKSRTWYFAYFPYSIAFGMLPVLIPLYLVDSLKGSLLDLGLMIAAAALLGIPASIFFGKLPDRFGRTKPFILASFLSTGLLLVFLSEAKSIIAFQALYVLVTIADSLHPTPTSVLIAESYHKKSWGAAFSKYNFVAGVAQAIGLAMCSIFITSVGYETMLFISSPLVLTSFVLTLLILEDSPLYVERWLSRFERPIDEVSSLAYQLDTQRSLPSFMRKTPKVGRGPRMTYAGLGFMMFSFATACTFTSLPIYLTRNVSISSSMVFTIFLIRSVVGTLSYILVGKWIGGYSGLTAIKTASGLRIMLAFLLPTIAVAPVPLSPSVAIIVLSAFSFSWSLFSVGRSTVIMEYASEGTLGAYEAIDGFGSMAGGLLGGAIPAIYDFNVLFIVCSAIFATAFLASLRI